MDCENRRVEAAATGSSLSPSAGNVNTNLWSVRTSLRPAAAGTYSEYVFDKDGNPQLGSGRAELSFPRRRESSLWAPACAGVTTGAGRHIAHYENGETFFIYSGRLGTAGIVTDYSGAVIQDELHYPWGQEWTMAGTMTEERFASLNHRDDATNLDPTHFRMYSSDQGRWLTPDPASRGSANPTDPQSWTSSKQVGRGWRTNCLVCMRFDWAVQRDVLLRGTCRTMLPPPAISSPPKWSKGISGSRWRASNREGEPML